jgi:Zn-dependent peptidase ImmA (M78 family)
VTELFSEAEKENITVEYCSLPKNKSMSFKSKDGDFILIDYSLIYSEARERVQMAHELGHCMTGSFYKRYSPYDIRSKHEYRATKWSIRRLISEADLNSAFKEGCVEIWELAERFNVTEDFMRKAVEYYKNLALLRL